MKKTVAGVLLSLILFAGYEAFAAFPSFVASAVWSSDLRPDPDYVDETDVDFLAVPDSASPDPIFTEEVPENEVLDGETLDREELEDVEEEKPQEEITTPTDVAEIEEPVMATPDKALMETEKELEDEPIVEGEIEQ